MAKPSRRGILHRPQPPPRAEDEGYDYLAFQVCYGVPASDLASLSPLIGVCTGPVPLGYQSYSHLGYIWIYHRRRRRVSLDCRCWNTLENLPFSDSNFYRYGCLVATAQTCQFVRVQSPFNRLVAQRSAMGQEGRVSRRRTGYPSQMFTVRIKVLGGKLIFHCLFDVPEKNSAAL